MDAQEKLRLLKSLKLLEKVPADQLSGLAQFLEPVQAKDGETIFEEGSAGDSLFFVASGKVRVMKKVLQGDEAAYKDLAILSTGDCFGEMALFEAVPRSARAVASGDSGLFRLGRKELDRWLGANPQSALGFFAELVQVLSKRLRRTSSETTLLYDLSHWLLEPIASGKDLMQKVLLHLIPHLEGSWTAGAYLYNEFNDEMDLVASLGDVAQLPSAAAKAGQTGANSWIDDQTYVVTFPGKKRPQGYLAFRNAGNVSNEEKTELGRTLTTVSRLITSALENIAHRTEDSLRTRLANTRSYGSRI